MEPVNVRMIRHNMDNIPQFDFPEGFGIRPMMVEDAPLWTEVVREAEEHQQVGDDLFMTEFGSDLQSVPKRCFLVVNQAGEAVGTTSAWYWTDLRGEWGLVHWVAVRPAYQGLGLGKAAAHLCDESACRVARQVFTQHIGGPDSGDQVVS